MHDREDVPYDALRRAFFREKGYYLLVYLIMAICLFEMTSCTRYCVDSKYDVRMSLHGCQRVKKTEVSIKNN